MFQFASQFRLLAIGKQDEASAPSPAPSPLARPDGPGRWQVTLADGRTLICRVIDQNCELRAIRSGCFSIAVAVDQLDGTWVRLD